MDTDSCMTRIRSLAYLPMCCPFKQERSALISNSLSLPICSLVLESVCASLMLSVSSIVRFTEGGCKASSRRWALKILLIVTVPRMPSYLRVTVLSWTFTILYRPAFFSRSFLDVSLGIVEIANACLPNRRGHPLQESGPVLRACENLSYTAVVPETLPLRLLCALFRFVLTIIFAIPLTTSTF